jgi:hypothetical protein
VPLCALIVIGPEVKHKIDADIYSTHFLEYALEVHEYFTLYAFKFNLCFILVLGYFCMNIFKMFLEYFWNIFKICFGICFKSTCK